MFARFQVSAYRLGYRCRMLRLRLLCLKLGMPDWSYSSTLIPLGCDFDSQNNDVGATHIALNVADLQATYDRLQALGVPCNTQPFPSSYPEGWGWFYARDPDGITVEFNGPLN